MSLPFPLVIILSIGFVFFGACVGSFLNVCIWRLPRGESLVFPNSHCPQCGHALKVYENVPVIAWLCLRGKCRYCAGPIAARYVLIEVSTAALFLLVWFRSLQADYNLGTLLSFLFLTGALLAIAVIDTRHFIIPDKITVSGLGFAFAVALIRPGEFVNFQNSELYIEPPALLKQEIFLWLQSTPLTEYSSLINRGTAVLDTLGGAFLGGIVLWAFLEVGRLAFGKERHRTKDASCLLRITPEVFSIAGEKEITSWNDALVRRSDKFKAEASHVKVYLQEEDTPSKHQPAPWEEENVTIVVQDGILYVGDTQFSLEKLDHLEGEITAWQIPREVLGFGDVKLVAMIGAFVGIDAVLFVLTIAAVLGTVGGGTLYLVTKDKEAIMVPFGPFLAGAALLWVFTGEKLFNWYMSMITPPGGL